MPEINTLIPDIYDYVSKNGVPDVDIHVPHRDEEAPTLRLSQMGSRCPCALWNSIHHPELGELLQPYVRIKFTYGHAVEALAIILAKAAGHEVTGEQDVLVVDGVKGHRDCVIDGCVVDVKSTTTPGFQKFKDGSIEEDDLFGYLDQIDGYLVGSLHDPLVRVKDRGYLLAIDKQLGHMCIHEHFLRETNIRNRIAEYKRIVSLDKPPVCRCGTMEDGKSGNVKLDVKSSYNQFKHACFPGLRIFLYSDGPRYLTHVGRRPIRQDGSLIPEVDKFGKIVYNN